MKKLAVVSVFAVAMGLLEAVVVVYLREIYYPEGFQFPLSFIEPRIYIIELVREVTTLVMLICIGLLVGHSRNGKFGWFLFVFGAWDIFYYAGLKLFLDWPESFLTWDILFLIPVTWIGPVLAPVICAATMIWLGLLIASKDTGDASVRLGRAVWWLLVTGAVLVFISFTEDFTLLLINAGIFSGSAYLLDPILMKAITTFIPQSFNWWIFMIGEVLILLALFLLYRKFHLFQS